MSKQITSPSVRDREDSLTTETCLVAASKLKQLLPENEYQKIEKREDYSLFLEKVSTSSLKKS